MPEVMVFKVLQSGFLDCRLKGFPDERVRMAFGWVFGGEQKLPRPLGALYSPEIGDNLIWQRNDAHIAVLRYFECYEPVVEVDVLPTEISDLSETQPHGGSDEHHAVEMWVFTLFAMLKQRMQLLTRQKSRPAAILLQLRDSPKGILIDPLPFLEGEGECSAQAREIAVHGGIGAVFLPRGDAAQQLLFRLSQKGGRDLDERLASMVLLPPVQMRGLILEAPREFAEVEAGILLDQIRESVLARLVVGDMLPV